MRPIRRLSLVAVAVGAWLLLSPVFLGYASQVQALVNDLGLGTLVVGAGLWRAYGRRGGRFAGWTMVVCGVGLTLSPWLYGRTGLSLWNALACGVLLLGLGLAASRHSPGDRPLFLALVPGLMAHGPRKPRRPRRRRRRAQR